MTNLKYTLFAIIFVIVALLVLSFQLPVPASAGTDAAQFHVGASLTILFALLHVGAVILLLAGLKDFKRQLRRAYASICLGLVFVALALLQYSVFGILNLWESGWFTLGGANLPYLIAAAMLFVGLRRFAGIIQVKTRWASPALVGYSALALGIAAYIVIQAAIPSLPPMDVVVGTEIALIVLFLASAMVSLRIKQGIGPAYTSAMAWFTLALIAQIFTAVLGLVINIAGLDGGSFQALPPAIAGILFMRAGYVFNKITLY